MAAVLPEDRADVLLHSYDGGGMDIQAPAILIRKKVHKNVSITANHYLDRITSASVDVLARASVYSESRDENSLGLDFLNDKAMFNVGYTNSKENDFTANTFHVGVSQDFFGDLTNLSLGYSRGNDEIRKTGDSSFEEAATRQHYRFGVTQIVTKNTVMTAALETITDQGYLNNPYRAVRYSDEFAARGFGYIDENYPVTRTSTAIALDTIHYLPYRASAHIRFRVFSDSWGISSSDVKLTYVHAIKESWVLEVNYRFYTQEGADFYSDLFPFEESQNFYARDKELSAFEDHSVGIGVTYEHAFKAPSLINKASLNFFYTFIHFSYDDFRDVTAVQADGSFYAVGQEPLLEFDAGVARFFVSIWF